MKILKKVLLVLVILIALIAVIGLMLPREARVERSTTINASPASIYEEINNLERANNWSPWFQIDPEGTVYTFSGPPSGVGNKMEWDSDNPEVKQGSQEIIEAIPNQKTRSVMYFSDGGDEPAYAEITLQEEANGTLVTWTFEADMGGSPISRIFGMMMDTFIGPHYESGLANLKTRVESKPVFSIEIIEMDTEPINYLAIRETFDVTKPEDIGPRMGEIYGQLVGFINESGVMGMGQPMSVYVNYSDSGYEADIAIPVADASDVTHETILVGQTTGGKVVRGVHMGDYHKLDDTHKQLQAYIQFNDLEANGDGYEVYVTDPTLADTALWRTDVYYPVK